MGGKDVILVTGSDLAEQAMVMLQGFEVVFAGRQPTEDDLIALCERHNPVAILVRYGRITAKVMDAAPALQVISKHGSGIDVIDQTAAAERNIAVRAAPGANAAAVAEHTWALILACAKSVVPLDKRLRDGHWDKATHKSIELEGLTLGLIGLGAAETLTGLLSRSDVISLHCPLTDENRGMINSEALAHCKRNAILVNTARGGLIHSESLLAALRDGTLHSAALDSFTQEPLTAPHLWQSVENVVISPHIGGVTAASYIKMGTVAAGNILAVTDATTVSS
ncbi:MAG: NAD(P)-dependent oxidoreductase [Enterobacter sp.]|nr:NAD(P)-dependent oxidoreductase [Enterobacter sp.]